MFDELEQVCDRVALIFNGKIIDIADMKILNNLPYREYKVEFKTREEYLKFKKLKFEIVRDQEKYNQVTIKIGKTKINRMFEILKNYDLKFMSEVKYNLEKHFKMILQKEDELLQEKKRIEKLAKDHTPVIKKTLVRRIISKKTQEQKKEQKKLHLELKNEKFFNKDEYKFHKKEDKKQDHENKRQQKIKEKKEKEGK